MRIQKTNRFIACGVVVVNIAYISVILSNPGYISTGSPFLKWLSVAITALAAVANLVLSYGHFNPVRAMYIETFNIMFCYMLCDVMSADVYMPYAVFAPISAFTHYGSKKRVRVPASIAFGFGLMTKIVDLNTTDKTGVSTMTYWSAIIFMLMFTMTSFVLSILTEKFNADIFGTLDDERATQQENMDKLDTILHTVTEETTAIQGQLISLGESSQRIVDSIQNVSEGTNSTVEAVEEQSRITGDIQKLVAKTSDNVTQIKEITTKVEEAIVTGTSSAGNLSSLSEEIHGTNEKVTASMAALRERTKTMQSVIDEIVAISNQTTLLALNASIEAARAGEAGRGFSVVADEIRNLSDQTKASTENIRSIISELENDALEASNVVNESVDAVAHQADFIAEINEGFGQIEAQMQELNGSVGDITGTVEQLVESNKVIVDAVSQLSAVSEEVTASTTQVLDDVVRNKESVETARQSVDAVLATADEARREE